MSEVLRLPSKIIINDDISQNETLKPFKARSTKYCACHEKEPPKPQLILTYAANGIAECTKYCGCHADATVSKVLRLSCKTMFQTSKCGGSRMPATKNVHSLAQKMSTAPVKVDLQKRAKPATRVARSRAVEMDTDISQGNFCASRCSQKLQTRKRSLTEPGLYTFLKNSVWTPWGTFTQCQ